MLEDDFVKYEGNWASHRPFLWKALENTKHFRLPVLELGAGDASTPYLRQYCNENGLELYSYDNNAEWAIKHNSTHVTDWNNIPWQKEYGVAFVDEAPGEHRKISLSRLHHVKIVICHDSEPAAEHGYQMRPQILKYKYSADFKTDGAWASAMSNFIDVSGWTN